MRKTLRLVNFRLSSIFKYIVICGIIGVLIECVLRTNDPLYLENVNMPQTVIIGRPRVNDIAIFLCISVPIWIKFLSRSTVKYTVTLPYGRTELFVANILTSLVIGVTISLIWSVNDCFAVFDALKYRIKYYYEFNFGVITAVLLFQIVYRTVFFASICSGLMLLKELFVKHKVFAFAMIICSIFISLLWVGYCSELRVFEDYNILGDIRLIFNFYDVVNVSDTAKFLIKIGFIGNIINLAGYIITLAIHYCYIKNTEVVR